MASPVRLLFLILLIFVGYYAIDNQFSGQELGFLDEFNYIFLAGVIILTIINLLIDASWFRKDRRLYQFTYGFIGLAIIAVVFFKIIQQEIIYKSKTILTVTEVAHAHNDWKFEFKKNNYFLLTDYNLFGRTVYQGKYARTNDTIIIRNSNYDGRVENFPKTGIMRNDTMFWVKSDTMLMLPDSGDTR
jgi:hypothetical protein